MFRLLNRCNSKMSRIPFYRFPTNPERCQWIAAVDHKHWIPTEHSWICGAHFILFLGVKAMIVFLQIMFLPYSIMRKDMERYKRMACTKKRRIDNSERMSAAWSLLQMEMAQIFVNHTLAPQLLHLHVCPCMILKTWNVDTITWKMKTDDY